MASVPLLGRKWDGATCPSKPPRVTRIWKVHKPDEERLAISINSTLKPSFMVWDPRCEPTAAMQLQDTVLKKKVGRMPCLEPFRCDSRQGRTNLIPRYACPPPSFFARRDFLGVSFVRCVLLGRARCVDYQPNLAWSWRNLARQNYINQKLHQTELYQLTPPAAAELRPRARLVHGDRLVQARQGTRG